MSPEGSAEPGQWITARAEYQREPMDAVSDPDNEQIVMMLASQVGKSEIILNTLGYFIDQEPSPILVVQPRVDDAKAFSKDRIAPMLRDTPCLRGKVADARSRDSGNTTLHKALALNTPIPTPSGWTTMGDIKVGDEVFDETGSPCRVTYVTPVVHGRPCWRITFSDGAQIVADGDHPWYVERWKVHKGDGKPYQAIVGEIRTTDEVRAAMERRVKAPRNIYSVPNADPLDLPEADLAIDPYLLGVWLGDGYSHAATIVVGNGDEEMIDLVREAGATARTVAGRVWQVHLDPGHGNEETCRRGHVRAVAGVTSEGKCRECVRQLAAARRGDVEVLDEVRPNSIRTQLQAMGLLVPAGCGRTNKHIPAQYLRASIRQRMALLHGLMDTDGNIMAEAGTCRFSTTVPRLADDFAELLASLGFSFRRQEVESRCHIGDEVRQGKNAHLFSFTPPPDRLVFRLSRKLARQTSKVRKIRQPSLRRQIVAIEPAPSVPVRCISVDSLSHLYLAGDRMVPTHNTFAGGHVTLGGANSPAGLAMRPIRVVLADEVDRYPASAGTEGDPLSLATKRTSTFWNRKIIMVSTPTLYKASRIEAAYEETDKRRYYVPCPHCRHEQLLVWANVRWDKAEDGSHRPETARYCCESCGALWTDGDRWAAVQKGKWRATAISMSRKVGFHLNALYSPWKRLEEFVVEFLESKDHQERFKAFVNTVLAETFRTKSEAPDWKRLYDRREDWPAKVLPEPVVALTAGVDVQKDRIEVRVWGWSRGPQAWLIDVHIIPGDPNQIETWKPVDEVLRAPFKHPSGALLKIARMAVDSGYATASVYRWARGHAQSVMVVKGAPDAFRAAYAPPTRTDVAGKKRSRTGVKVWPVGTAYIKDTLYGWMRKDAPLDGQPYPDGWVHLPKWAGDEELRQLTAEGLVTEKDKHGYPVSVWVKLRERNEALDCAVYAYAAMAAIGLERASDAKWRQYEDILRGAAVVENPEPVNLPTEPLQPAKAAASARVAPPAPKQGYLAPRRPGGGWLGRR